ncbi:MAG: serine acetyltransferase [Flavobacterium sp.]|nr:serine acetyltransferase [Pedobacter sp.]
MEKNFLQQLESKQQQRQQIPTNKVIAGWASKLISTMYPEISQGTQLDIAAIERNLLESQQELVRIMDATKACSECNHEAVSANFFSQLPEIFRVLNTDINAINQGDPASTSTFEVIRAYPGFLALCFYRISHALHLLEVPLLPRILTEYAHSKTGIDIHPAAKIAEHFMIDHGTGIVIGETAEIGRYVKIYQGVTLGALSVTKKMAMMKRHPTIKDNVVIYSGATILGGDTVIGEDSVIGGNVWLTKSVPAGSLVYHNPEITVVERKFINDL